MSESKIHNDIFTNSGCLTSDTLKSYLTGEELSDIELAHVKDHLNVCEFCSDALEGLQLMSDPKKLDSIVSEINENLHVRHVNKADKVQPKKFNLQPKLYYFAAAASVLILIGFYFYLQEYLNSESTSQSISQVIDLDNKSIPPMPKAKFQEIGSKPEGISQQNLEEAEPIQKEKSKDQIKIKNTTQVAEINQSIEQDVDEEDIAYVPPLKAVRGPEDVPKSLGNRDRVTDAEETFESEEYVAVDIASTQPIEYYIGGVIVYDKANDKLGLTSFSAKSNTLSEKGSQNKRMDVIPQTTASGSKQEMNDELMEDNVDPTQSDFENETKLIDENHFFSMGNEVPQYPGGYEALIEYLNSNLNYPKEARDQGIQGQLVISFIIEKNGELSSASIIHGIGGGCDEEALRVIKLMPDWQPAYKEGSPKRVLFNMPITFKLN